MILVLLELQKPAKRVARVTITYWQSPFGHPTPPELRARSNRSHHTRFFGKIQVLNSVSDCWCSVGSVGPIQKNQWFSRAISELKWTVGFIFYSFEVLISTIELQSMSLIGPLVMKIDDIIDSAAHISAKSASLLEHVYWSSLICDGLTELWIL